MHVEIGERENFEETSHKLDKCCGSDNASLKIQRKIPPDDEMEAFLTRFDSNFGYL